MRRARPRGGVKAAMMLALALIAACRGDGDGGAGGQATPTQAATPTGVPTVASPTATATPMPAGAVAGLVVVRSDVRAARDDALSAPPEGWAERPGTFDFDRALSYADWRVDGDAQIGGVTGPDGRFEITGLRPGRHTLTLTKTLDGNLASFTIPFAVGDDGGAEVLAELSWGLVRSVSRYSSAGQEVREVFGANGSHLVVRDGRVVLLGDGYRILADLDGDGLLEGGACAGQISSCEAERECPDGQLCQCVSSCPFCEDCGALVCAPPSLPSPYRCDERGTCDRPGDECVCVSSCPQCADCMDRVCVPSCEPIELTSMTVSGPSRLALGRRAQFTAVASVSDGTEIDVTQLVDWRSANDEVLTINGWGSAAAVGLGEASVTASLGEIASEPWPVEVVEKPALRRIELQNVSCYYPLGRPTDAAVLPVPPVRDGILPPSCHQVVRLGGTIRFAAYAEFEDGYYEDVTGRVEWQLVPSAAGSIEAGLFTALAPGAARLASSLDGITSNEIEIRVVTEPTIVALTIYPVSGPGPILFAVPEGPERFADPCFHCGYSMTLLIGDELRFQATAQYDTGEWEDVTDRVTWRSSDPTVTPIDDQGVLSAAAAGEARIDATLDEVTSNPVDVRVVEQATLQSIYIYQEGQDRVVKRGGQALFRAVGYYDVGFQRDLTAEATWRSSDEAVGGFDEPGVFTGRAAGSVSVWAELDGVQSDRVPIEVFDTSDLEYCDPADINRGHWSDAYNRVVLESDCAYYQHPAVAVLRFTVTETSRPSGIFDPCLDLFVYRDGQRVRTIREEGCGDPFLAPAAPERDEAVVRYQLRAFWDLKDDRGNPVAPGTYTIHGRFYLYYDPVVSIEIAVLDDSGEIPTRAPTPTRTPTAEPPPVCTPPLCAPGEVFHCERDCPGGCGITCATPTPTPDDCCPVGALCGPLDLPPCEPQVCGGIAGLACPDGQVCDLRDPTCQIADLAGICSPKPGACPRVYDPVCGCDGITYGNDCERLAAGATLAHLGPCEPALECCPPNARCTPDLPPCRSPLPPTPTPALAPPPA